MNKDIKKTEEIRKAKILYGKSGGTSGRNAITNRLTIPTTWVKKMGITYDDRDVEIILKDNEITIKKIKE